MRHEVVFQYPWMHGLRQVAFRYCTRPLQSSRHRFSASANPIEPIDLVSILRTIHRSIDPAVDPSNHPSIHRSSIDPSNHPSINRSSIDPSNHPSIHRSSIDPSNHSSIQHRFDIDTTNSISVPST